MTKTPKNSTTDSKELKEETSTDVELESSTGKTDDSERGNKTEVHTSAKNLAQAKPKSNNSKGKPSQQTSKRNRKTAKPKKRVAPSKQPTIRKVPMADYDSGSKILTLYRKADIAGESVTFDEKVEVDLKGLTETERQLVIATAKVSVNFAKNHDPSTPQPTGRNGRSLLDKLKGIVQRLRVYHTPPNDEPSKKAKVEETELSTQEHK
jgi:hypothetical protein